MQNEGFCLALASALKLDVVKAEVQHVQGRSYLLVERHDRKRVGNAERVRIHQEDFCQALAIAPENKYQNEGGPNLAQSFDLLRRVTRPSALEILKLVDCVIFNALIGNYDAHGKNFSLIYQPQGAVLAPLYDALSTAVYPQLTDKMAMKLGGKYRFSELHARHWEKFAHEAGLSPSQLSKRVLDIARRLPQLAHQVRAGFIAKENDHPILAQIVLLIEQRCAMSVARLQS